MLRKDPGKTALVAFIAILAAILIALCGIRIYMVLNRAYYDRVCLFEGDEETVYRIPGIVTLKSGTLIAYCEERDGLSDWSSINIVYRRSTDGGENWEEPVTLANGWDSGLTINNPVMIADDRGNVHCLYETNYGVDGGSVFYTYSADDGVTWSEAIDISSDTGAEIRNAIGIGPGHGIQLSNGTLLVTAWMVLKESGAEITSHHPSVVTTIYSSDYGQTWEMGEIIYSTETVKEPNESTVVELSDGTIMINSRNISEEKYRAVAYSPTGYSNWSELIFDTELEDPVCFGALTSYNSSTLLFINAANQISRENITIKISYDDGQTWPIQKTVVKGEGGYADIVVSNKIINAFVEKPEEETYSLYLYRCNLKWILS